MLSVDINCDTGEGTGNDEALMPYISSANIACGYHAGDNESMRKTMELARRQGVAAGAHVSFPDKENFGRTEMSMSPDDIYEMVIQQVDLMTIIASSLSMHLHHVKPHGALYNQSAKDKKLARLIARAIHEYDEELILFGLSGSYSISEAKAIGMRTAAEAFADRSYQDDGSLTPRSQPGALLEDADQVTRQVLQLVQKGTVTSITGKEIPVVAETICIHGDGAHAVEFAAAIHDTLKQHGIALKAC